MRDVTLTDEYGKRTLFRGELLVVDETGSTGADGRPKPRYSDVRVWRTEAGKYVIGRETHYRIWHRDASCQGLVMTDADGTKDLFPCPACNVTEDGAVRAAAGTGYGQVTRCEVEVYHDAKGLIRGLETVSNQTGKPYHSRFARSLLVDISDVDDAVAALWMNEVVA